MDCWIGVVTEPGRRVVRVAGRLSAAHVPELMTACADDRHLELDLTELMAADAAGIDALRRIRQKGATLSGTPGYIQLKLDAAAPPGAASR